MRYLLLCSLLFGCSQCAHLTPAETALLQCNDGQVPATVAALGDVVGFVLDGISPLWESTIDALAAKYGAAEVYCAVQRWAIPAMPQAMAVSGAASPQMILSNRQRNAIKYLGSR